MQIQPGYPTRRISHPHGQGNRMRRQRTLPRGSLGFQQGTGAKRAGGPFSESARMCWVGPEWQPGLRGTLNEQDTASSLSSVTAGAVQPTTRWPLLPASWHCSCVQLCLAAAHVTVSSRENLHLTPRTRKGKGVTRLGKVTPNLLPLFGQPRTTLQHPDRQG